MDAQNNPYYNVYDRTLPGNGSIGAMEAPLNRPLFIPGNGVSHAACMAVIDDRTGAAPPVLYLMRRGSTHSQLVAIRLDDLDNVQPVPLHTFSDFGAGTMPEMQVSPDGQYLAVSSRVTNSGSIFPALETYKIILFRIDPDHLGLTEVGTLAVPNTVRISSLDFSPESAYLYFVRTISEEGHRLYRVAVPGFSAMEAVNTGARITEVRRIKGDRMLLTNVTAINGGQRNIYALHTPNAATGTLAGASAGLTWSFNSTSPYITTALSPHLALQSLIIHTENPIYTRTVDLKRYELTDHLGNVRAVVSDRLLADYDVTTNADPTNLRARVLGRSDYYPFGSLLPGRNYSSTTDTYRFGFQGQESDGEINGERNSYAFEYRMHDPRVGRFLSIDPLAAKYPHNSPYAFSENRVIDAVELEGLEYATFDIVWDMKTDKVLEIRVTTDYELKDPNTRGPGLLYNLIITDGGKPLTDQNGRVAMSSRFDTQLHGIYQGPNNPKLPKVGESRYPEYWNYDLAPIDETDANAKQHDLDYDKKGLEGLGGVMDFESTPANEAYIDRANTTIEKAQSGGMDSVTGKPVTPETAKAAEFGRKNFRRAENVKGFVKGVGDAIVNPVGSAMDVID